LRQNSQAIPAFERALAEDETAVALSPDDIEYKVLRCTPLENLGEQYADLGKADQALHFYTRAIAFREALIAAHPEKRDYLVDLADTLAPFGNVQRPSGDSAGALRSFAKARSVLEGRATTIPADDVLQARLGAALVREAGALADLHQPE